MALGAVALLALSFATGELRIVPAEAATWLGLAYSC
jgi:hypothetical protein